MTPETPSNAAATVLRRQPFHFQIAADSVTATIDFDTVFLPGAPLEVDLGAGRGRFLLARAAANPGIRYIAIERLLDRVRKINRQLELQSLSNVRIIRLEASYALQYLFVPQCINTIYILFPDPWPKRRHHRRRLFSAGFLTLLHERLKPGGTVQIATDHLDYFAAIQKVFNADARFAPTTPTPRLPHEQTDFELIFRAENKPIGECAYINVAPAKSFEAASGLSQPRALNSIHAQTLNADAPG